MTDLDGGSSAATQLKLPVVVPASPDHDGLPAGSEHP